MLPPVVPKSCVLQAFHKNFLFPSPTSPYVPFHRHRKSASSLAKEMRGWGGVCPSEWVGWRRALTSWAYPGQTEPRLRRPAALQAEASRVLAAPSAHDSTGEGTSDVSQPLYHSLNFPDTSSELPGEKPCQACPETILCPSLTLPPHHQSAGQSQAHP